MGKLIFNQETFEYVMDKSIKYSDDINNYKDEAISELNSLSMPLMIDLEPMRYILKKDLEYLAIRSKEVCKVLEISKEELKYVDNNVKNYMENILTGYPSDIKNFGNYYNSNNSESLNTDAEVNNINTDNQSTETIITSNSVVYNESTIYGADQTAPYYDYLNKDNPDTFYEEIIKSHYKDISDEQIVKVLTNIKNQGCGYAALANYIITSYLDREEEFEKQFGFPLYNKNDSNQSIINVNYLLADIYCYYNNEDGNPVSGGMNPGDIECILGADRYKDSEIKVSEFKRTDNENFDDNIREIIGNGNDVLLFATTYDLYTADIDNERVKLLSSGAYPHVMTITGIAENGDYIVSTYGKKCLIDPSSLYIEGIDVNGTSHINDYNYYFSVSIE